MRRSMIPPVSIAALAAACSAHAASPPVTPDVGAAPSPLAAVVVVANRAPEPIDKVGQSVTVLTLDQIRADQEPVVSDMLARTPGITVTRNGGVGGFTALNIRGALGEQTLVLVDGVQLNDLSSPGGGYNFADLLTGDIARIEVLRGPQSTLYGSQAIGGVVNVVTGAAHAPFEAEGSVEGGSYGTYAARATIGGKQDQLSWRLSASDYATTGISAFDRALGGREADGYSNQGVSGRVAYALSPGASLDLRGLFVSSRVKLDGYSTPTYAFGDDGESGATEQGGVYAGLNADLLDGRLKNRVAVQYASTLRNSYDPADAPRTKTFYGLGTSRRLEYQGLLAIAPGWSSVFGSQHEQSAMTTASPAFDAPGAPPTRASAHIDSGYAQLQGEGPNGLNLTAGLRYDVHATFGGHALGQASAAWSPNGGDTVVRASWGQGFKAPTLYQLYSPYGNLALGPEQATGWDGGLQQRLWGGKAEVQATAFRRDSTGQIGFTSCYSRAQPGCANGRYGYYANIAIARASGLEMTAVVRPLDGLQLSANYTRTDAVNRSPGASYGKRLARIAPNAANAEASYRWASGLTTAVAVRYAGDSFDDAANTIRLKAYSLTDLRASYPLTPRLQLYGRVENVADAHYETTYRYGALGRAAYVGIRAAF